MKHPVILCFFAFSTLLISGCDSISTGSRDAGVLLVDLGAVAKALGRDQAMQSLLEQANDKLNNQLLSVTTELTEQLETEKGKIDLKQASEEERDRIQQLALELDQQLAQTQQLARKKALLYRNSLVQGFRNEVKTQAAAIAGSRGAKTVMVLDQDTLWLDPASDITGEVIDRMRAQDRREDLSTRPPSNTDNMATEADNT